MERLLWALCASVLVPTLVLAQPSARRRPAPVPVTTWDEHAFGPDPVVGRLLRPDVDRVEGRTRRRYGSLIRIRNNFVDAMLRTVENQ